MIQTIKIPIPAAAALSHPAVGIQTNLPPIVKIGTPYAVGAQVWLDVDVDDSQPSEPCDWGLCVQGQQRPPSGIIMSPVIYANRRLYAWSGCIA